MVNFQYDLAVFYHQKCSFQINFRPLTSLIFVCSLSKKANFDRTKICPFARASQALFARGAAIAAAKAVF